MTAAQHAAGRLRQGHLAFAPVLRPDSVSNTGSAAAGGSAEALERKRNADGSVKIEGGHTEPHVVTRHKVHQLAARIELHAALALLVHMRQATFRSSTGCRLAGAMFTIVLSAACF